MNNEDAVVKTEVPQAALAERTCGGQCYRPNVDILEEANDLLVVADVPGAKSDSIDVKFEDGILELHAVVPPRDDGHSDCLLREYDVGDYYRSFRVSEAIDAAKISATYADGVLTLRLPKAEAMKPRKIAVSAN